METRSEKAKVIVLKSPLKGASSSRTVTTIDFLSPRCDSASISEFRRRHRTERHPDVLLPPQHPSSRAFKPGKPLTNIDANTGHRVTLATAIATPCSNRLVKTAVKRKVPTSATVSATASRKSPPSNRVNPSHFSTPTRALVPESFRIAMATPVPQSLEGSPLAKSLETAPHSVKVLFSEGLSCSPHEEVYL